MVELRFHFHRGLGIIQTQVYFLVLRQTKELRPKEARILWQFLHHKYA